MPRSAFTDVCALTDNDTPAEGLHILPTDMTTLALTHSHVRGTLLDGSSRGAGSAQALKAVGRWRRSRNVGWYVPHSRDRRFDARHIQATKTALEAAGFEVAVEIDDEYRDTATVEADRAERQEARVEALEAKAERKAAAAEAAWEAERRANAVLPPGGEPIHVGHHNERRHRMDRRQPARALRVTEMVAYAG